MLYVRFSADGVPECVSRLPADGFELVELPAEAVDPTAFLAEMRRRSNGTWVKRPRPPRPTEAEIAAEREAARLARIDARREARRAARDLARRDRLFDRLVEVASRIDPEFAAEVAKLEAEFSGPDEE